MAPSFSMPRPAAAYCTPTPIPATAASEAIAPNTSPMIAPIVPMNPMITPATANPRGLLKSAKSEKSRPIGERIPHDINPTSDMTNPATPSPLEGVRGGGWYTTYWGCWLMVRPREGQPPPKTPWEYPSPCFIGTQSTQTHSPPSTWAPREDQRDLFQLKWTEESGRVEG
jgi:hypothetical protein